MAEVQSAIQGLEANHVGTGVMLQALLESSGVDSASLKARIDEAKRAFIQSKAPKEGSAIGLSKPVATRATSSIGIGASEPKCAAEFWDSLSGSWDRVTEQSARSILLSLAGERAVDSLVSSDALAILGAISHASVHAPWIVTQSLRDQQRWVVVNARLSQMKGKGATLWGIGEN